MRRTLILLAVLVTLAAAGCTTSDGSDAGAGAGGNPGTGESTPSATASASPTPTYRAGERTPGSVSDLCGAISRRTLHRLGFSEPTVQDNGCGWHEDYDRGSSEAEQDLTVRHEAFAPPQTRRQDTATDQARYKFRRLPGWEHVETTPVRGMGDQAKVSRLLTLPTRHAHVWIAVRWHNVIIEVQVKSRGSVRSFDELEAGTVAATQDVLAALDETAPREPTVSSPGSPGGPVERIRDVCDSVTAARRLVPGATLSNTAPKGSGLSAGCRWEYDGDERPDLDVNVEVIRPSRTTREGATRVARRFFRRADGEKVAHRDGIGNEAKLDHFSYDSGSHVEATLVARKGNLLVCVEYGRWKHPQREELDRDVLGVARRILEEYG